MSFSFLLGILACCISSFVSVNRLGYALNGALCAIDRIYYDIMNGEIQLQLNNFDSEEYENIRWKGILEEKKEGNYKNDIDQIIGAMNEIQVNFTTKINYKYKDKAKLIKIFLKEIARVFFWFLLIIVTCAAISMMFYSCLKRQGYLIMFMHILWNSIRFFMVSFFIYGTFYGKYYRIFQDSVGLVKYIFSDKNEGGYIASKKNYLKKCFIKPNTGTDDNGGNRLLEEETSEENIYEKLYCEIIRRDVNILYWALDDASNESQILCSLSLCSSFFGAVAVYFFLLVIHHYNNEIFFDIGKSIFTGMEGFGGGYKKKDRNA